MTKIKKAKNFLLGILICLKYICSQNVNNIKEGFYLSFSDFKNKNVISREVLEMLNNSDINKILQQKSFSYIDSNGLIKNFLTKNLWGAYFGGALYINFNENFYKITTIEPISLIIVPVKTKNFVYDYDPIWGYYYHYAPYAYTENTQFVTFILDFNTGNFYNLSPDILLKIFANDQELYKEYSSLKRRKKKQLMFYYIKKYNERNPLSWLK